jgi:C1A family cysteine protease
MRQISKFRSGKLFVGMSFLCLVLLLTGVTSLFVLPAGTASAEELPQIAPLNPEFEQYILEKSSPTAMQSFPTTDDGHALGYIPPPFKAPSVTVSNNASINAALPATFDLRTSVPVGVTAVRNQAMCGSCWAFGTMGSLESHFKFKLATTTDFSEADLNENHGGDWGVCMGGNYYLSTAYLARWGGVVTESNVPYPYWFTESGGSTPTSAAETQSSIDWFTESEGSTPTSAAETQSSIVGATPGVADAYHIQNVYFLPQSSTRPHPAADLATLKTAIQTNGAVGINVYWDNARYNATKKSLYVSASGTGTNHAVTAVGWNDSYSKANFVSPQPAGNGAFIVKNSWGTGWGESGYFYLSYYDMALDLGAQFYDASPTTNYTRVYQYDPLGWVNNVGYTATTAWYSNIFMASVNASTIKAVSTYSPVPNSTYTVYVYKNVNTTSSPINPRSGTLVTSRSGTLAKPGYNTIALTTPAVVTANKPFSVVVKMTSPGYKWPIPVEYAVQGYSTAASSCPGQSFISSNGTSWGDLDKYEFGNACLKAFATK